MADAEEGRWLLAALRAAVHVHLGFGSFGEYVERLFGYGRRCTQEKLRVAEALEELTGLGRALGDGVLTWSAVRELTRVAVPETEQAWLEVAHGKSVRQLEELIAGKPPGDSPESPVDPRARRHVLRFEVSAETFASLREAFGELRRRSGSGLNDDEILLEMARCVLAGPNDDGRSSYQIALTVCAACRTGSQDANGDVVPVGAEIVDMAGCDGQRIGHIDSRPANDAGIAPAPTSAVTPTPESAHVGAHTHGRAKQDIPPAVRRAVLRRDHHRCRVPGCRNATFLDLHHIVLRSDGGLHHPDNLLTVCGAHHRALHRGEIAVERDDASGALFRHADGAAYGEVVDPTSLDVQAKVFGALRGLGFREGEVRRVMGEMRGEQALRGATAEVWLRAGLERITGRA